MQSDFFKELKNIYGKQEIAAIEKTALAQQSYIFIEQKRFYGILYYLRHTGRYAENKRYKKAPWSIYLRDTFKISEPTYHNMVQSIFSFPDACAQLGTGLVTTVRQKCGAEKSGEVLAKIIKLKDKTHPKIEKIIDRNLRPSTKKNHAKPSYAQIERQLSAAKDEIRALTATISEKDLQIEKLKAALEKAKEYKDPIVSAVRFLKYGEQPYVPDEVPAAPA